MVDLKCKTCRINTRENLSKLDLLTRARSVKGKLINWTSKLKLCFAKDKSRRNHAYDKELALEYKIKNLKSQQ